MKLWPEKILPYLPNKLLIAQHRDCCALRGKAWGRNNKEINYVFKHGPYILEAYHFKVLRLLQERKVYFTKPWLKKRHRGLREAPWTEEDLYGEDYIYKQKVPYPTGAFYTEQDEDYWQECRAYLKKRKIKTAKRLPAHQPMKRPMPESIRTGGHLCACTSCGFSLIGDEDSCCPRCEAKIDNKAQPEAVLILPCGDIVQREMMSPEKLRLSNMLVKNSILRWRYISFSDRMMYRRWLGKRMKREDFENGPVAEEVFQLMKSQTNPVSASRMIPVNMKPEERKRAFMMWLMSTEDSQLNKVKGKVKS